MKLKIRAIIPNESGSASNWWRITQPFSLLHNKGHDVKYYFHDEYKNNDVDFKDAIVLIHRLIPADPKKFVSDIYAAGASFIFYSIDDYVFDKNVLRQYLTESGGLTTFAIDRIIGRIPKQLDTMLLCNSILVTTSTLADLIIKGDNIRLDVLANAIDLDYYIERLSTETMHYKNGNLIHIGYASGRRPERDLIDMVRAWKRIDSEFENVRFVVAGYPHDIIDRHINPDKKIRIPWRTLETWPQSMQVDIGCCPLSDIPFNIGKSPIKYFEYSMAGAAVIASRQTDVYKQEILSGGNGFLAANEEEWYTHLKTLIENKNSREYIVDSATYNITNYRSLQATIENWEQTFNGVLIK